MKPPPPMLAVAILVSLALAGTAAAAIVRANLGLAHAGATCDGQGSYGYTLTWSGGPAARYQVNSGNQCRMGPVCSISGRDCAVSCSAQGTCSARVANCVVGKGAPWIKVTALDGSVFQQITAAPPSRCQ